MPDFAFRMKDMKSGNPAVYLLKEQFESFATSPQKTEACDKIAHYLHQLEQYREAGAWYEAAAKLSLAGKELRPELRALLALKEYEKAMECFREGGDLEAAGDCSTALDGLKRACAPA